jgi:hypothetical protein
MGKYVLGNTTFNTLKAKQTYILEMAIDDIKYLGKESKLSEGEKELRNSIVKDLKKVIKSINKEQK